MTGKGIKIGTIWGQPLTIHSTFLLAMGLFVLFGGLIMIPILMMVFVSILLHELSHVAVARYYGYGFKGIILHGLGGAALIMPRRSFNVKESVNIALAGPAVNFMLAFLTWVTFPLIPHQLVALFFGLNVIIGCFNLLPLFPLDGGRIFHALIAKFWGLDAANSTATWVTRFGAVALGAAGLAMGAYVLVLIAGLLFLSSWAQKEQVI